MILRRNLFSQDDEEPKRKEISSRAIGSVGLAATSAGALGAGIIKTRRAEKEGMGLVKKGYREALRNEASRHGAAMTAAKDNLNRATEEWATQTAKSGQSWFKRALRGDFRSDKAIRAAQESAARARQSAQGFIEGEKVVNQVNRENLRRGAKSASEAVQKSAKEAGRKLGNKVGLIGAGLTLGAIAANEGRKAYKKHKQNKA